jgi:site-specific DNA recombinase
MTRAILYARVSTEEQARKGYSLAGQFDELREYAADQDYKVLDEIEDRGYGRTTIDRPGMNEVMERVAFGGVDVVLAWRRDRFGVSPYPQIMAEQFAEHGCKLRALDDLGEGDAAELMNEIKDAVARLE